MEFCYDFLDLEDEEGGGGVGGIGGIWWGKKEADGIADPVAFGADEKAVGVDGCVGPAAGESGAVDEGDGGGGGEGVVDRDVPFGFGNAG